MTTLPAPIGPPTPPQPLSAAQDYGHTIAADSIRGLPPGLYLAADLYRHYAALCGAAGLHPAASNRYGMLLRRLGLHPRHDNTGTRRCWVIPATRP